MVDSVFLIFTGIFVLTAFFRGFVKECFALFTWILSFIFAYALSPYISPVLKFYTKHEFVADIIARVIVFLVVFITVTLVTSGPCKELKEKFPAALDKSLGIAFGLIKTLLVFGLIQAITMTIYTNVIEKNTGIKAETLLPKWLTEAKTYGIIKISGSIVQPAVNAFSHGIIKNFEKRLPELGINPNLIEKAPDQKLLDNKINEVLEEKNISREQFEEMKNKVRENPEAAKQALEKSGYKKQDIEKMNRLIEIVQ